MIPNQDDPNCNCGRAPMGACPVHILNVEETLTTEFQTFWWTRAAENAEKTGHPGTARACRLLIQQFK